MSMFNDISCGSKDNESECLSRMPNSFLFLQKDLEQDNGHLLVLVLKRSGTVSVKTVHKEYGTILLKGCWWNSQKADNFPCYKSVVQRSAQKQRPWKIVDTVYCADLETIETIFRIISTVNDLSLHGAAAEMCEECESLHERTGRPVVWRTIEFLIRAKRDQDRSAFGL